jgi:hypothetical protein
MFLLNSYQVSEIIHWFRINFGRPIRQRQVVQLLDEERVEDEVDVK